ncbi:hypothetical protein ACWDBO_30240 [Streptomyces mirabilis]
MNDKDCGCADHEKRPTVDNHAVVSADEGAGGTEAVSAQDAGDQERVIRTGPESRGGHESRGHPVVEGLVKGVATVVGAGIARWLLGLL